ncbi:uncharacterized protein PMYN1_Mit42 (mitochondrion) [Paulinella micropora]|uniref:Uncharacterized protein n=1 Tax=Paulinella micropora TaxID=1928728 RepID=A0A5K7W4Z8_9EUKA|nr:uncharacterized protein PMYN1_Mit42 [Paulinella micropora]BBL86706.1 uncharacterized protein PMYN1_Mit42 [Paulinella micropora]
MPQLDGSVLLHSVYVEQYAWLFTILFYFGNENFSFSYFYEQKIFLNWKKLIFLWQGVYKIFY